MLVYYHYLPWWWVLVIVLCVLFLASLPFRPYARKRGWRFGPSLILAILTLVSFVLVLLGSFW